MKSKRLKYEEYNTGKYLLLNQIKEYISDKPQKAKLKGKYRHI